MDTILSSSANSTTSKRRRQPLSSIPLLDSKDKENFMHRSNMPSKISDPEVGEGSVTNGGDGNPSTEQQHFLVIHTKLSDDDADGDDDGQATASKNKQQRKAFLTTASGGFKALTACLLYSFCSVSMILVNKSLASSYNHLIVTPEGKKADLNILLVVFQAAAAVVFLWGCKFGKILHFDGLTWNVVKAWAPVNIFFCLMLFTSMAALETNSVPMVTIFKNVANITTATGDYLFFGNILEPLSIAAFAVMLIGAISASRNDMETSFVGLFWMLFNCFATSGYVCYMRYATQTIKMTKFGMVYVNNVLCVLFLVPVALVKGEISLFMASTALHSWDYGFKNFFAGFVGFFLNTASLHCVSVTGPTTYAIVGSLNKVPVTFLGWFLFKEQLSAKTWFFVSVSLLGGFLYTYAKIRAKKKGDNDKKLARGASSMPLEPSTSENNKK